MGAGSFSALPMKELKLVPLRDYDSLNTGIGS